MSIKHHVIGDDFDLRVEVTNDDKSAANLTGATIEWGMTRHRDARFQPATPDLTKSVGNGLSVTDNVITLELDRDDITIPGAYHHQFRVTFPDGKRKTPYIGTIRATRGPLPV